MDDERKNKDYPYLEVNLLKINDTLKLIAENTKKINWNLGKLNSILEGNEELKKKIDSQEKENKK